MFGSIRLGLRAAASNGWRVGVAGAMAVSAGAISFHQQQNKLLTYHNNPFFSSSKLFEAAQPYVSSNSLTPTHTHHNTHRATTNSPLFRLPGLQQLFAKHSSQVYCNDASSAVVQMAQKFLQGPYAPPTGAALTCYLLLKSAYTLHLQVQHIETKAGWLKSDVDRVCGSLQSLMARIVTTLETIEKINDSAQKETYISKEVPAIVKQFNTVRKENNELQKKIEQTANEASQKKESSGVTVLAAAAVGVMCVAFFFLDPSGTTSVAAGKAAAAAMSKAAAVKVAAAGTGMVALGVGVVMTDNIKQCNAQLRTMEELLERLKQHQADAQEKTDALRDAKTKARSTRAVELGGASRSAKQTA